MREALIDLLQVTGLRARAYVGAGEFLADLAAGDIAVLVTDVRMPAMDGLELQRQVKALHPAMPVIFVTSSSNPETRARAMEQGALAYFNKPVGHALIDQIHVALAR